MRFKNYDDLQRSFEENKKPLRVLGYKKWQKQQELRSSLAGDDPEVRSIAALIDLDHVMETGKREDSFEQLALAIKPYRLDPSFIGELIQSMYPELRDIVPPPPDQGMDVAL